MPSRTRRSRTPRSRTPWSRTSRSRTSLAGTGRRRGLLAATGALAVLATVAGTLTPASAAVTPPARTVRVDPLACAVPTPQPGVTVVCTPRQVSAHLIDGTAVVLSPGTHSGPLDLRGRRRVSVTGLPGAVLDAAGGRYALSLRDMSDVVVEGVALRGGTAQTVWLERMRDVVLRGVSVQGGAGAGLQLRDTTRFTLTGSRVTDAAAAGVMELTGVTDSTYRDLVVSGNGHGPAAYNGDGLQLSGSRVSVTDVVTTGNGSSPLFEHGVYVAAAARSVTLAGVTSSGNSGVAVKLGGSGTLVDSALTDDRIALYCGTTSGAGWTVRSTTLSAPRPHQAEPGCKLRTAP